MNSSSVNIIGAGDCGMNLALAAVVKRLKPMNPA